MKKVLYDFMELKSDPSEVVDGSDEILRPEDRVNAEDRNSPDAGAFARAEARLRELDRTR